MPAIIAKIVRQPAAFPQISIGPSVPITITGFRELNQSLLELPKATERNVLKRALTTSLQDFVDAAKQLVPVHEGHLRDSIVIGTQLTGNGKKAERAEPKGGVRMYAGTANRNGVPREFGSERSPAEPFMRPAWDQTSDGMVEKLKTALGAEIERAAARVARKAAKS